MCYVFTMVLQGDICYAVALMRCVDETLSMGMFVMHHLVWMVLLMHGFQWRFLLMQQILVYLCDAIQLDIGISVSIMFLWWMRAILVGYI